MSGTTVHTNPNWMDDFKKKFPDLIVQKCSELTRDAFERNSDIYRSMSAPFVIKHLNANP